MVLKSKVSILNTNISILKLYTHENSVPLVVSMGGGYSDDIKVIIVAHANTYGIAQEIYF